MADDLSSLVSGVFNDFVASGALPSRRVRPTTQVLSRLKSYSLWGKCYRCEASAIPRPGYTTCILHVSRGTYWLTVPKEMI